MLWQLFLCLLNIKDFLTHNVICFADCIDKTGRFCSE
uniref:Uncharacterized protein n=1 Tax=Anguilla anguilla TaxID=7936 RepID=A0A0E9T6K0_ANGAN